MKTLGLIFSLILLVIGGGILILFSFPSLAFNWQDFLIYLVIAAIVYGIVRVIGGSLDRKFNRSVSEFLEGKKEALFDDKGLLRTFGLLLITILPFLLYLLAFALYAAITFTLYGLMLVSHLPRIPVAVLLGLAAVALGTGLAILIGFYRLFFPPRRKTLGVEIGQQEQKRLWLLVQEVAADIDAKPINKIIITPDPGIGVYLEGGLFRAIFGRGRRVLEVGLPSIHNLEVDEFKAILAHEYGHFSNRDTQWTSFTYAMGTSLLSTLQSVPGPARDESEGGGIARAIMSLNPAYWTLLLFTSLYFRITNGFSRIREVMADIAAMNLYGGQAFRNGLLKVAVNDVIFGEVVQAKHVPELLQEGKVIADFSGFIKSIYEQIDEADFDKLKSDVLSKSAELQTVYDSHPSLKVRAEYANRFDGAGEKDTGPVSELFDDWDGINERAAELYNRRLMMYVKVLRKAAKTEEEEPEA